MTKKESYENLFQYKFQLILSGLNLAFKRLLTKKRNFLDIPRWQYWESIPAFMTQILPPLYLAFLKWKEKIPFDLTTNKFTNEKKFIDNIDLSMQISLTAAFQAEDFSEVMEKINQDFEVNIQDAPAIKEEDLYDSILSWNAIMNEHTWKEIIPGQPKIGVLESHLQTNSLPRKIIIYDKKRKRRITLDRLFSHFYIPDIYQSEKKAPLLFKFLVENGELDRISDYDHKRKVTEIILEPVSKKITNGEHPNILDVGCGDGFVGDFIKEKGLRDKITLNGIDITQEMLDKLQKKETYDNVRLLGIASSSAQEIKTAFKDQNFTDVILAFVDIYLSDKERKKAFKTIYDLLPVGGTLSFDVHHPDENWKDKYKNYLEKAGFSNIELKEEEIPARDGVRKVGIVFAIK